MTPDEMEAIVRAVVDAAMEPGPDDLLAPADKSDLPDSEPSHTFPLDGHWHDKPTGREWASPHGGAACDNPKCRRCLEEGYR